MFRGPTETEEGVTVKPVFNVTDRMSLDPASRSSLTWAAGAAGSC